MSLDDPELAKLFELNPEEISQIVVDMNIIVSHHYSIGTLQAVEGLIRYEDAILIEEILNVMEAQTRRYGRGQDDIWKIYCENIHLLQNK